jgi:hypothetical protein
MPHLANAVDPQDVDDLRDRAAEAKAHHRESFCKTCGQLIEAHAWTKVDLETMAKKVDHRLTELGLDHSRIADYYLRCYLQPTAHAHATGTCVNEKFELVDGHWTYKMDSSRERRQAIMFGHALLLILLGYQNQHFGYSLDDVLRPRLTAMREVWNLASPSSGTE